NRAAKIDRDRLSGRAGRARSRSNAGLGAQKSAGATSKVFPGVAAWPELRFGNAEPRNTGRSPGTFGGVRSILDATHVERLYKARLLGCVRHLGMSHGSVFLVGHLRDKTKIAGGAHAHNRVLAPAPARNLPPVTGKRPTPRTMLLLKQE